MFSGLRALRHIVLPNFAILYRLNVDCDNRLELLSEQKIVKLLSLGTSFEARDHETFVNTSFEVLNGKVHKLFQMIIKLLSLGTSFEARDNEAFVCPHYLRSTN